MRFWTWALEAYARPGAAQACLTLQDDHGQCVPYLLWAAWAAGEGRPLDGPPLQSGAALAAAWEGAAVGPLRAARRAMKREVQGMADGAREALRAEVKALELQAEQMLIDTLQALAPEAAGAARPLAPALSAAAAAWGSGAFGPGFEAALERLAQTLS